MACMNYVYCNRPECFRRHFNDNTYDVRMDILGVKNALWSDLKKFEPEEKTKARPCQYFLLCFEKDCSRYHGGLCHDARKVLRKATNQHLKKKEKEERVAVAVAKVAEQVEAMSLGLVKKLDWADEC